ncbi:MAG: hypothetical protein SVS85_00760 [Candidatus Nanohaloarchaea archaeon]|nr:hypothetical protein [Candidatus Nanohaloarchaea archaeon]
MGKGFLKLDLETVMVVIIALIVVAVLGMGMGMVGGGIQTGLSSLDSHAIYSMVTMLEGTGDAQYGLVLQNNYSFSVSETKDQVKLEAGFLDSPRKIQLPEEYEYSGGGFKTQRLCVTKKGMRITFSKLPCEFNSCNENRCSVHEREGTPVKGFYCRNGVYTSEGFFHHYYSSGAKGCGTDRSGDTFVEVNRFSCPEQVDSDFTCTMTVTWNCGSGGVKVKIGSKSRTWGCGEGITHERFAATVAKGKVGGVGDIKGKIKGGGETSSKRETVRVG